MAQVKPVGFDIETGGANQLFLYGDPSYVRLSGYTTNDGIAITTDPHELIEALTVAPWIYGHGIYTFDMLALCFYYGVDWWDLASKALDTMILDRLDYPPQARDTGGSEDKYDLNHSCERRGIAGKTDNIRELAAKHGGYDKIPLDDNEYRDYLMGDVAAVRGLIDVVPRSAYARREHQVAAINGLMTLNGFRVNIPLLNERIEQGEAHKTQALEILRDDYDLPLGRFEWHGKGDAKEEVWADFGNPLATLEGRKWFIEIYDAFGVRNPPITDTGRLAMSADALSPLAESPIIHPDLRRILNLMSTVTSTRTVYQTVADHLVGDRVHPIIKMVQASGRSSVTEPGLTVFGKREGRHVERGIFVPEDGYSILSCDLRQVDMRAVAVQSQDPNYMSMFGDDRDPHAELALQIFGSIDRRDDAKPLGHGWNYGLGKNRMIANGHNPALVKAFFERMTSEFPRLCQWREEVREQGAAGNLLDNGFGRMMRCEPERAFTQAPALKGQGCAADILKEAILRIPPELVDGLRVTVHDEVVGCWPTEDIEEIGHEIKEAMTFAIAPDETGRLHVVEKGTPGSVPIECDLSRPGQDWAEVCGKG